MAQHLRRTPWIHAQAPVKRWGRCAKTMFFLLCLVITPVLLLYTNMGQQAGAQLLTSIMQDQAFSLEAEALSLMGSNNVVLHDVTLHSLPNLKEVEQLHVDHVVVSLQPWRFLLGKRGAAIVTKVELHQPTVHLRSSASASSAKVMDSQSEMEKTTKNKETKKKEEAFTWPWQGHPITIIVNNGAVRFEETMDHISVNAHIEVGATDVTMREFALALQTDGIQRGRVEGKARLFLGKEPETFIAELSGRYGEVMLGDAVYTVDSYRAKTVWTGDELHVQSLVLQHHDARVDIAGYVDASGDIDAHIESENIIMQRDIPVLARYGFNGSMGLHGELTGSLTEPVFQGQVYVGPGSSVWYRENVMGQGTIHFDTNGLTFSQVHLEQYGGSYMLNGRWNFPRKNDTGDLDLHVVALSGRVSEVIALFPWNVPATGRIDGEVYIQGPIGQLSGEGYIDAVEAVIYEQPLDHVMGAFAWDTDGIILEDVMAALGSGVLHVDGYVESVAEKMDVTFSATDWPLGFTRAFIDTVGETVGGLINVYEGSWKGSWQQPRVSGMVHAEALRTGPFLFRDVQGKLTYSQKQLFIDTLSAERAGGGAYEGHGIVQFSTGEDPLTDITMQVRDERLGSLLKLAHQDVPALIFDGIIRGSVAVMGSVYEPEAIIDVNLQQAFPLQNDVRMLMELRNGTLRVNDMEIMHGA